MMTAEAQTLALRTTTLVTLERAASILRDGIRRSYEEALTETGPFSPALDEHQAILRHYIYLARPALRARRLMRETMRQRGYDADLDEADAIATEIDNAIAKIGSDVLDQFPVKGSLLAEPKAKKLLGVILDTIKNTITPLVSAIHMSAEQLLANEIEPTIIYPTSPNGERASEATVVSVDLSHYSQAARDVDKHLGADGLAALNTRISDLIDKALGQTVTSMPPVTSTGDGAIVYFDEPLPALAFAKALHAEAEPTNHFFRVGISTGAAIVKPYLRSGKWLGTQAAGLCIIDAVRLESSCPTGALLLCDDTYKLIAGSVSNATQCTVQAKPYENREIAAWQLQCAPPAPWEGQNHTPSPS